MAVFNRCLDCQFAVWNRTTAGRLHPDGGGRCIWTKRVALPASVGDRERGGIERTLKRDRWIDRSQPIAACDTFVRANKEGR